MCENSVNVLPLYCNYFKLLDIPSSSCLVHLSCGSSDLVFKPVSV